MMSGHTEKTVVLPSKEKLEKQKRFISKQHDEKFERDQRKDKLVLKYENQRITTLSQEKNFFTEQKTTRDTLASRAKERIRSPIDNKGPNRYGLPSLTSQNKFYREKSAENKKAMFAKRPSVHSGDHNFSASKMQNYKV